MEHTLVRDREVFLAWKRFKIGGVSLKNLIDSLGETDSVSEGAEYMMRQKSFIICPEEMEIDTILLSPADFGYTNKVSTAHFLDPDRLAQWSRANASRLRTGHMVALLPAEIGPHIVRQHRGQWEIDLLKIAMARIFNNEKMPSVFWLVRNTAGNVKLCLHEAIPSFEWHPTEKFLFWLRKFEGVGTSTSFVN